MWPAPTVLSNPDHHVIMIMQGQTPVMIMTHGSWSSIALLLWTMGRICRSEYIHQDNTTMLSALWWSGLNCTLRPYYGRHKIKSPSTNQQSQLFVHSQVAYETCKVQPAGVKASVERQLERSMSGAQLAPVWCLEYRAF